MVDKLMIPEDLVTRDTVVKMFNRYPNSVIMENVANDTILSMSTVICGRRSSDIRSACDDIRTFLTPPTSQTQTSSDNDRTAVGTVTKKKLLATYDVLDAIAVSLYKDNNDLYLEIRRDGSGIVLATIELEHPLVCDYKSYQIEDIGSGKSKKGDYYLAVAAYGDSDDEDIPQSRDVALIVHTDDTVTVHDTGHWSDSELTSCYIFDEDRGEFVWFTPKRPN